MQNLKPNKRQSTKIYIYRMLYGFKLLLICLLLVEAMICLSYAQEHKIAILPFTDTSDYSVFSKVFSKKYTKFVREGLPEIIMTRLSNSTLSCVVELPEIANPKTTPSALAQEDKLIQIGSEHKVTCIIKGSFRLLDNNRVRIDARVYSTKSGRSITGESIEGNIKEKENLAELLAEKILTKMRSSNIVFNRKYTENLRGWNSDTKLLAKELDPTDPSKEFIITGKIWFENQTTFKTIETTHRLGTFEIYVNQFRIAIISPNAQATIISQAPYKVEKYPYIFYVSLIDVRSEYIREYRNEMVTYVSFSLTIEKVNRIN